MRIIGYIEHPVLKITVFKMDNKIAVQFENNFYEQTYKFRNSEELNTIADVQRLVDPAFVDRILAELAVMHRVRQEALNRFWPEEEEGFEDII